MNRPFRIAHLSDPHLGPLPAVRARDLLGKRLTGFVNWHRARKGVHDMAVLDRLVADVAAAAPDLVLVGGDITNIGLPAEFEAARSFLDKLGAADNVLLVPGNHDVYVRSSLPAMRRSLARWMGGGVRATDFPYVVRRGDVAVVALNSGRPSLPFYATGRLGRAQLAAARRTLAELGRAGLFRVVLVHHAPHIGGSRVFRNLTDAKAFEAMLAEVGAELVLHGHNHRTSLAHRRSPAGPTPIVGVGSASASAGSPDHRASWHLVEIAGPGRVTLTVRRIGSDGRFVGQPLDLSHVARRVDP